MKTMILSSIHLFLDYAGYRPSAFDPCVDLSPPHMILFFTKRSI